MGEGWGQGCTVSHLLPIIAQSVGNINLLGVRVMTPVEVNLIQVQIKHMHCKSTSQQVALASAVVLCTYSAK